MDPDGCLADCGDLVEVASLDEQKLGGSADVVPLAVAEGFAGANMFHGEHYPSGNQSTVCFGNSPIEGGHVV